MSENLGTGFPAERDPTAINFLGSKVVNSDAGREIQEVGEIGVVFNISYWGAVPRQEYSAYKCFDFPCRQHEHTTNVCAWQAINQKNKLPVSSDHGIFNYKLGRSVTQSDENTNIAKTWALTLERCAAMNFNHELCLYGIVGCHNVEDIEVKYLDEGVTLCKFYLKEALQDLTRELGGASECTKNIKIEKLNDISDLWKKEFPGSTTIRIHGNMSRAGSLVDQLPIEGAAHSPMETVQYIRSPWTFVKREHAKIKSNPKLAKINGKESSGGSSKIDATLLEWTKIEINKKEISGYVTYGGVTERMTCTGAHEAFSDDWIVCSGFSGLHRAYTKLWRDLVFALTGSVKIAACKPTMTNPVVIVNGVKIAELVPVSTARTKSAWLGEDDVPKYLTKGSFHKGGPLTLQATRVCGQHGLTEFPVIGNFASLYNRLLYAGGPASCFGACVDQMFFFDYGLNDVGGSIERWYDAIQKLATTYEPSGSCKCAYYLYERGRSALIAFHGLNYKRSMEDSLRANNVRSRALAINWIDRRLMMEFCYFDGGMPTIMIDCALSRRNRWDGTMGRFINDLVDFGFDVSCSEYANMVFTLSEGEVTEAGIRKMYQHFCHALNSMYRTRAGQAGAIANLITGTWQLADYRHKTMEFMTIAACDGLTYNPCTASNDPENCFVNRNCELGYGEHPCAADVTVAEIDRLPIEVDTVTCSRDWVHCIAKATEYPWYHNIVTMVTTYKIMLNGAKQGLITKDNAESLFCVATDRCCAAMTYMCRDADGRLRDAMWRALLELYCFDGVGFYACRGSMVVIKERAVGDERELFSYSTRPFE